MTIEPEPAKPSIGEIEYLFAQPSTISIRIINSESIEGLPIVL
jgi:hypothetical protein